MAPGDKGGGGASKGSGLSPSFLGDWGQGDPVKDLKWLVGLLVVIFVLWLFLGGPGMFQQQMGIKATSTDSVATSTSATSTKKTGGIFSWFSLDFDSYIPSSGQIDDNSSTVSHNRSNNSSNSSDIKDPQASRYADLVTLRLGQSGERVNDLDKEYVIISASTRNEAPVNITGWEIDNGKSEKTYTVNSRIYQSKSTIVTIPYGTLLLDGKKPSVLGPILLYPGEQAYIVSGQVPIQTTYKIDASFKVNKCTGYLAKLPSYSFYPSLYSSCPRAEEELNLDQMPDSCVNYIRRYGSSCLTPELRNDSEEGILLNGSKVPSVCRNLITASFSYPLCLAKHKYDQDFLSKKWYVYLKLNSFPIYATERATITLYDNLGKIVDIYSY